MWHVKLFGLASIPLIQRQAIELRKPPYGAEVLATCSRLGSVLTRLCLGLAPR